MLVDVLVHKHLSLQSDVTVGDFVKSDDPEFDWTVLLDLCSYEKVTTTEKSKIQAGLLLSTCELLAKLKIY